MKNILFVCSANKQRSKTADDYFSAKYPDLHFESAGTNLKICQQEGTNPLTEEMVEWADVIFVMDKCHKDQINQYKTIVKLPTRRYFKNLKSSFTISKLRFKILLRLDSKVFQQS